MNARHSGLTGKGVALAIEMRLRGAATVAWGPILPRYRLEARPSQLNEDLREGVYANMDIYFRKIADATETARFFEPNQDERLRE
jgi:hypothetical protein